MAEPFGIQFEAFKRVFFDRAAIINRIAPAARKVYSRFGALVMTTARQSMRRPRRKSLAEMTDEERKDFKRRQRIAAFYGQPKPKRPFMPSKPGEPPRAITGLIKKMVLFGYDEQAQSVVIGPALINSPTGAPEVLEYGGMAEVTAGPVRGKQITIQPRPFMTPAFAKHRPKIGQMWRDALK